MKQFLALDGEGYTIPETNVHIYNLLGASDGTYIYNKDGCRTRECFEYLCELKNRYRQHIFVTFYFSYDVNMILGNVPREAIDRLKKRGFTYVYALNDKTRSYKIEYMARKFFCIIDCIRTDNGDGTYGTWKRMTSVKIWDVFGFFQTSFVQALKDFKLGTLDELSLLQSMKSQRSTFNDDDIQNIIQYNQLECTLLVQLMEKLNDSLERANLNLHSWHGAGAVAQQLLNDKNVLNYIEQPRGKHKDAVLHAYFGGRIQAAQIGDIRQTVYRHDIVSAYPAEIANLPSLYNMRQKTVYEYDHTLPYTVWHVSYDLPDNTVITPFPHRLKDGRIDYALKGEGYYWDCEVRSAMKYYAQYITVHRGYQFVIKDFIKPFDFVSTLFEKRREYKKAGNFAQYAIKLALNSCYGKLVQNVGLAKHNCMIWGGLITAGTRAKMFDIAMEHPEEVIAFATDGLLSKVEHTKHGSGELGTWEVDTMYNIFIIKPGIYQGRAKNKTISRVRGFMSNEITWGRIKQEWRRFGIIGSLEIPGTRFIGMKASNSLSEWRTWVNDVRTFSLHPSIGTPDAGTWNRVHPLRRSRIHRIIPNRYDDCSTIYDSTFFDDDKHSGTQIEQEY